MDLPSPFLFPSFLLTPLPVSPLPPLPSLPQVLVLSCGHELYFGPADAAEQWFTDVLGYPRPHDASAADYLLDVVNTDYGGDTKARQRVAISAMQGEEELRSAAACFRASERFSQAIGCVACRCAPDLFIHV